MKVLVTGAAGFIGYHLCAALLHRGDTVIGFDNLNDYYDVSLKTARLARLQAMDGDFSFVRGSLEDRKSLDTVFAVHHFDRVVNLAAQAGVRYSLTNPDVYVQSNLVGFANILECCRQAETPHLTYASSSSVYGLNTSQPFSVHDNVDHPISLYAATKKANELMAHTYSHLYGLPTTGLRFFTVYGPWGRPDMALFLFTRAILEGRPIDVFNNGHMQRDFTYIDDIIQGVVKTSDRIAQPNPEWNPLHPDPGTALAPYRVYNIGNHSPVELNVFIELIEKYTGRKAIRRNLPMQPGDVFSTCADVQDLRHDVGFAPNTPLSTGIGHFIEWYRSYYNV
jgi:UDP-glucuronate 4-epimerase